MTAISAISAKKDLRYLAGKKRSGTPITMITCYDYPTAQLEDGAGIDIVFVGDSVGTNMLGYASETEVTLEDMVHHLKAVRRGVTNAYLLVDLPYGSYRSPELALQSAATLLRRGADGVKLEGGREQAEVVRALVAEGIEVCGHIGFTPQTLGSKGRVQAKTFEAAKELIESALALEAAGAGVLVLELVTEQVAALITDRLRIPTIGIGSGRYCDGQVLVVTDVLGISAFERKIFRRYMDFRPQALDALSRYRQDVEGQRFPTEANAFPTDPQELAQLREWLDSHEQSVPVQETHSS